jgi:transposase
VAKHLLCLRLAARLESDSIDAVAVARAALREGLNELPAAQLEGPELDLRLLVDHRERLVRQRVALNNTLQWHLHDLWPEQTLPGSALFSTKWSTRIGRRLARAEQSARVRIARDELRRLRELTQTIKCLEAERKLIPPRALSSAVSASLSPIAPSPSRTMTKSSATSTGGRAPRTDARSTTSSSRLR